jgi:carbonic anhydrase
MKLHFFTTPLSIIVLLSILLLQSCSFNPGVVTKTDLKKMTPAQALTRLEEGNKRFNDNQSKRYNLRDQRLYLNKNGQYPPAIVLTSTDARIAPELIFNQGLGDVFCLRSPASIVTVEAVAGMENACRTIGSKIIVLLMPTRDPFIELAVDNDQTGNQTALNYQLKPAIDNVRRDGNWKKWKREDLLNLVLREHLMQSLRKITQISPILRGMQERGEVFIVGAMYDIETGKVNFLKGGE